MCGILGSINIGFNDNILDSIKHRGPDDKGIIETKIKNSLIKFAHVRLSIQDLSSAGHQPMESMDKNFIIIFNGEIYNHYELREKLSDINFIGHSDTETIVNYIAKFGITAIKDLNGIFALAILDKKDSKLYLARDRYGVKPIYYSNDSSSLIFASEIRPIQQILNKNLNKKHLATLLKLRYNPSPTTLLNGISKLRPGHILTYDLATLNLSIESFIEPLSINQDITFDQALKKYANLFEKAVMRQMLSDVEVGVLLSGGIDSALIAYFAQKHSKKPIKTFTIGFDDKDESDETKEAKETADLLKTEHYEIIINDSMFEKIFPTCIDIVEEPLGTTSIIPMYYLNQLVSNYGIKVLLTGQGADEPLGGYTRYKGELLHNYIPSSLLKIFLPFSNKIKNESIYRAIYALSEKNTIKRWELIYTLFNDNDIKELINTEECLSEKLIEYYYTILKGKEKDSTNAMMSNDIRMNLADDLLLYTDKISMNFSIETRVPMLDNDLVDFVESLPIKFKIQGKEGKYIHKKFAESILPPQIIYRKKKGFKSPTAKWFKGEKGLFYKKLLTKKNTPFAQIFNTAKVHEIFEIHMSNQRNMEKQLFTLISIYYWLNNNLTDIPHKSDNIPKDMEIA